MNFDLELPPEKRMEIQEFVHNLSNRTQFAYTMECMDIELTQRKLMETAPDLNNCPNIPSPHLPRQSSGGKLVSACTSVSGQEHTMVTQSSVGKLMSASTAVSGQERTMVPQSKSTSSVIKKTRDHVGENNELINSYGLDNSLSDRETVKNDLFDISDEKNIEAAVQLPFNCNICGKSFSKTQKLNNHLQSHYDVKMKPFSCDLCDQLFTRKDNLNKHKKNVHRSEKIVDQKQYKCDTCSKSFNFKRYLTKHKATHAVTKFKCSKCGKEFLHGNSKKEHESQCSFLPLQYQSDYLQQQYQSDYLQQQITHTNEYPASADIQSWSQYPSQGDNTQWTYGSNQNTSACVSGQFYNVGSGQIDSRQYYNGENMVSGQYYNMDDCGDIMNSAPMQNNNTSDYNSMSYSYETSGWGGYSSEI